MKLFRPVLVVLVIGICLAWFASDSFAATFTVTKTADTNDGTCDADCSLREAIAAANANAGADTIEFNIPTSDPGYINPEGSRDSTGEPAGTYPEKQQGYFDLRLDSSITFTADAEVFVNGYSQPGASFSNGAIGEPFDPNLMIQISRNLAFTSVCFIFNGSSNNQITGLNLRLYSSCGFNGSIILSEKSNHNWLWGNYLGSNINGYIEEDEFNQYVSKILIWRGSQHNIIGTNGDGLNDRAERNLITGRLHHGAVHIEQTHADGTPNTYNVVAGNYLRTDKTGRSCSTTSTFGGLQERYAMFFSTSSDYSRIGSNLDGVSDEDEGNIMGCVQSDHRATIRQWANNVMVSKNYVNTNPHGDNLNPVPGNSGGIGDITIGSGSVYSYNVISHSGAYGLNLYTGNQTVEFNTVTDNSIGIRVYSTATGSKTIRNNIVHRNSLLDIDIGNDATVNPNDPGDKDTGPNDLMNYPEIRHANHLGDGRYAIGGIIDGNLSEAPFTIELCRSSNHPSGHGGCSQTLATTTTTGTDWEVFITTDINDPAGLQLSALATNSRGSTSEFSRTVTAKAATPLSLPLPTTPDLTPSTGASITKDSVVAVAQSQTFNYDAYLSTITTTQTAPLRLPGTLFFQASPIHEIWWRAYANDAKILDSEVNTGYIIALKYQPESLDPNLNQRHLRLAYRPDNTASWKVLYNSVHDPHNHTVATVTKTGGEYMLVSRW